LTISRAGVNDWLIERDMFAQPRGPFPSEMIGDGSVRWQAFQARTSLSEGSEGGPFCSAQGRCVLREFKTSPLFGIEDMLERGIDASYETVRHWALKFGSQTIRVTVGSSVKTTWIGRSRPAPDRPAASQTAPRTPLLAAVADRGRSR
jgi:hypothetical protein